VESILFIVPESSRRYSNNLTLFRGIDFIYRSSVITPL